jgi:glycosyltransferase involved in cell wall biosynthesis
MADRIAALGARRDRVAIVTLGADAFFGEQWSNSVNVRGRGDGGGPVILSTRAHEPLYNIDDVIDAYALVLRERPGARLVVAHLGSLTEDLRAKAARMGDSVKFPGTVPRQRLRELMQDAEVFVSMPSSDGTSVALLQAMAAGAYPIVSDLETQREWIRDGVNGRRVAVHDTYGLARAVVEASDDATARRTAAELNRTIVEKRGTNETQMEKMERLYRWLANRTRSHRSA